MKLLRMSGSPRYRYIFSLKSSSLLQKQTKLSLNEGFLLFSFRLSNNDSDPTCAWHVVVGSFLVVAITHKIVVDDHSGWLKCCPPKALYTIKRCFDFDSRQCPSCQEGPNWSGRQGTRCRNFLELFKLLACWFAIGSICRSR
jgi:hypothetical protein